MFDFETALSGIDYKVRKLIDDNNGLREEVARLTEMNEELRESYKITAESGKLKQVYLQALKDYEESRQKLMAAIDKIS